MTKRKMTVLDKVIVGSIAASFILTILRAFKIIHVQWIVVFFPIPIVLFLFVIGFAFWFFYKNE
jgi:hypothetical protein